MIGFLARAHTNRLEQNASFVKLTRLTQALRTTTILLSRFVRLGLIRFGLLPVVQVGIEPWWARTRAAACCR
jgi:hypothetical protein